MDPPPTEKTRKPRTAQPYASKPGPKGPNTKNPPPTSAQPLKKAKEWLTNSDWIEVYCCIDDHPHSAQAGAVKHSTTWQDSALFFDQGSLPRNPKKRSQREAEVAENPAALFSKGAYIVTRSDVDHAPWMRVQDRMFKSWTVSGPELGEKRKIFEEKLQASLTKWKRTTTAMTRTQSAWQRLWLLPEAGEWGTPGWQLRY